MSNYCTIPASMGPMSHVVVEGIRQTRTVRVDIRRGPDSVSMTLSLGEARNIKAHLELAIADAEARAEAQS